MRKQPVLLGILVALLTLFAAVSPAAAGGKYPTTTIVEPGVASSMLRARTYYTLNSAEASPAYGTLSLYMCVTSVGTNVLYEQCESRGGTGHWELTVSAQCSASGCQTADVTTLSGQAIGWKAVFKGGHGYGSSSVIRNFGP